jgi:hypothetical protein
MGKVLILAKRGESNIGGTRNMSIYSIFDDEVIKNRTMPRTGSIERVDFVRIYKDV